MNKFNYPTGGFLASAPSSMLKHGAVALPAVSIVMQGPIYPCTEQYILQYLQFPSVTEVILSTWRGQGMGMLPTKGIEIVYSDMPTNPGLGNRNAQIVSSLAGIKASTNNYIFKTRTDMFLPYLEEMIDFYFENKIGREVFVLSIYPRFPFHPRDHVFFSTKNNLLEVFDIPLDQTQKTSYDEYNDVRSESYIGMWYYSKFDPKVRKMTENAVDYIPDNAPKKNEALELYHNMIISRKGFVPFPKFEIEWLRRYPHGYPFEHLKSLYGETFHEDLVEELRKK